MGESVWLTAFLNFLCFIKFNRKVLFTAAPSKKARRCKKVTLSLVRPDVCDIAYALPNQTNTENKKKKFTPFFKLCVSVLKTQN